MSTDVDFNQARTLSNAYNLIEEADGIVKSKLPASKLDTNGMTIGEAAFKISTAYVASYKDALDRYIYAVSVKHEIIEKGGHYLAEMQRLKIAAETRSAGYSKMDESAGMVKFLNDHGIPYDRTGGDLKQNPKEWQVNIEYLNNWIKGRSNEVETDVIKLNDVINKQNQLLQSATTILKKAHEVLEGLIKSLI